MNLQTDSELLGSLIELPHVYYNQALELAKAGSLEEARDKLVAVQDMEPDMLDARNLLGKVYARMGQYEPAIGTGSRRSNIQGSQDSRAGKDSAAKWNRSL
jgi:hypothetical protein